MKGSTKSKRAESLKRRQRSAYYQKLVSLRRHYSLLKHIAKCSTTDCQHLVRGLSEEVIRLMSVICVNVMNKTLTPNSIHAVKKLSPYKKQLRAITKPKITVIAKRRILQQKGGFIGALLGVALPLITSLIGSAVKR